MVERTREEDEEVVEVAVEREYTFEPPFTVEKKAAGFSVTGRRLERAVRMTDFGNEEAVRHLDLSMKRMGVFRALKRMGAKPGEAVAIGEFEFEYHPD